MRSPVPSRSLLRFLRTQSETAFFTPSRHPLQGSAKASGARICGRRVRLYNTDTCPCTTMTTPALEASLWPFGRARPQQRRELSSTTKASGWYKSRSATDSSSDPASSWQERLWGMAARRGFKPLKPDDLPGGHDDLEHGSMFNSRRVMTAKAAAEPRLRCTEVDEHGQVILVDGEFKKSELIAKYGLLPRDLRKIDSSNLPHILVRPEAILLNLLHLKVLIKSDRVLLFDIYGSKTSYPQSAFMYDLQGKLQQRNPPTSAGGSPPGLPYEFRALEAVLTSVTSEMEADFEAVREPVMHILSALEDDIDREKLRNLLILSKRVSTFEQKAKLVRDAIDDLLEADDDLGDMYLSEKKRESTRAADDHTEVEMLLESYHKIADEIVQEAGNLVSGIRNTEEIVRAILDANRNSLMLLDLKFSVGTLGLAMGTFLAGLYGMNLENFIEETNWGFGAVTTVSTVFSLMVCWYGLVKLRRVQRIKMASGERLPGLPRGYPHYLQDEGAGAMGGLLLDSRNREMLRRLHSQKAAPKKTSWFW
ncbi:inner membrane magnesium transporter MRS2 [Cordyceps fumosorosea ARSEF 2679]|uniref:Magnesium transporter n=1 Tax=Cordyceps fumosorosea (strain ARSEF 2679) TaxID=1081104 RepID=A0A167T1G7_CORFA|nr:inner membrane magnesium transporter MRS2 [Cordyceps fumosorosea ARSEF 2679]OAA60151.1 inner membrane magnesium transporter MRS2 [Cordyceps fumosorosea ARSEF 2679]